MSMPVSPPRPRGPHLNALRAFEAAARLGGFASAAEELSVTAGAVSQHVRALEDWAGAALFERRSQGVVLTALGAGVAEDFSRAFDTLASAQRRLRVAANQKSIAIATLPSVAQLWLSPRLPAIRAALPDYVISVTALETPPNLQREMFDISLFIGEPSGAETQRILADDVIFPVCAPRLAGRLASPDDLAQQTLLHDATWKADWARWLTAAGANRANGAQGPTFSLYSLAIEEARSGAGVLMGHKILLEQFLRSGELAAPFPVPVSTGKALILETSSSTQIPSFLKHIMDLLGH